MKVLNLLHEGEDGEVIFPAESESDGTKQLLRILGPMIKSIKTGATFIVDEIDRSLHPLLTNKLVQLFSSPDINQKSAQLIFSTHDSNILCSGLLRRDQIWLSEKSKKGATNVYSLSDLSVRQSDNFQKGYMDGRFGAVPFLSGVDKLFRSNRVKRRFQNKAEN